MNYEHIQTTSEEGFITKGVSILAERIRHSIDSYGHAIIGLSGGSTPKPIYEALGKEDMDWTNVSIFLIDERYCPPDSDDANQKLVRDTLLMHANIAEDRLYFPDTSLPIDECIGTYEAQLAELLSKGIPHVVTLGIGSDGHIASLFPPVPDAGFDDRLVIHTETDNFAVHDRISTTLVIIGSAERKMFFLKGTEKKEVWEEMVASEDDMHRWPAKAVLQLGGGVVVSLW